MNLDVCLRARKRGNFFGFFFFWGGGGGEGVGVDHSSSAKVCLVPSWILAALLFYKHNVYKHI